MFFETFLEGSKKIIDDKLKPEVLDHSIFDTRDESPTEKIQTRGIILRI